MRNRFVRSAVLSLALVGGSTVGSGVIVHAQEAKVPTTVDDHMALAKSYEEKAASYRKEAAYHRQMFEAYKKSVPSAGKAPGPNPWVTKMQKHCQTLEKDAEKLATDAQKAAEYHTLRAKELQGK